MTFKVKAHVSCCLVQKTFFGVKSSHSTAYRKIPKGMWTLFAIKYFYFLFYFFFWTLPFGSVHSWVLLFVYLSGTLYCIFPCRMHMCIIIHLALQSPLLAEFSFKVAFIYFCFSPPPGLSFSHLVIIDYSPL